jgi:hypothetical protein
VQQKDTQLKRLIKTRIKIEPFKVYQLEDCFVAELDDVEVFRTKHQHLCTSYCQIKIAEKRNLINQQKIEELKEFRAQGII